MPVDNLGVRKPLLSPAEGAVVRGPLACAVVSRSFFSSWCSNRDRDRDRGRRQQESHYDSKRKRDEKARHGPVVLA